MPKHPTMQKTLAEYEQFITKIVAETYAPSYSTPESIKNIWRTQFPYSKKLENLLIIKTKLFVGVLDSNNTAYKDPEFLRVLMRKISKYLSFYTIKASNDITPNMAQRALFKQLYDQSAYIQNLIKRRDEKMLKMQQQRVQTNNLIKAEEKLSLYQKQKKEIERMIANQKRRIK